MNPLRGLLMTSLSLLVVPAVPSAHAADADPDYRQEIETYRAGRVERLVSPTGWLTVCGFHWLEPGENALGSEPGLPVPLPGSVPARAGVLDLTEDDAGPRVILRPAPGAAFTIDETAVTGPTTLYTGDETFETPLVSLGTVTFWISPRNGRLAVRVRDSEAPNRKNFHGIEFYDIDPAYRVEGHLEAYPELRPLLTPNIMGWVDTTLCPGPVVFTLLGQEYRLFPSVESVEDSVLFFVMEDATTGKETYGGGRFLYTDLRPDGTAVLDFNRAYNPPCVFTDYATCPLPPEGNRIPIPVRAGEKAYHHD